MLQGNVCQLSTAQNKTNHNRSVLVWCGENQTTVVILYDYQLPPQTLSDCFIYKMLKGSSSERIYAGLNANQTNKLKKKDMSAAKQ